MTFNQRKSFSKREKRLSYYKLSEIELVFSRACNLKCSFCPQSNPQYKKFTSGYMSFEVLKKIINDTKNQKLFYHIAGYGEPTINKNFLKFIKYIDNNINQRSTYAITTNGIMFKKYFKEFYNVFKKLKKLEEIRISCYSNDIYNFFNRKKIDFISLKKDINLDLFNNRAGSINLNKNNKFYSCNYAFFFLAIDIDGDVSPCPHEWKKQLKLGNIMNENIFNIWENKKINNLRKIFCENKRQEIYPCNICTAYGTLIGDKAKKDKCEYIKYTCKDKKRIYNDIKKNN